MKNTLLLSAVACLGLTLAGCGGSTGPASLSYVEISPESPRLGDVVTVRFKLADDRGVPLAGQTVNFKLQTANTGVELKPTTATSIRGTGFAETQVVATARVNAIIVVATAGDRTASSPPIGFAGANSPSAREFTFQCGKVAGDASGGRHAIGVYDAARNMIAGEKIDCTAHSGDRNGDGIGGAAISFLSEAGAIGPSETALTDVIGNATVLYKSSLPLPAETTPGTFTWTPMNNTPKSNTNEYLAPLWMIPWAWHEIPSNLADSANGKEPRRIDPIRKTLKGTDYQLNPRDNLVTIIAVTAGEEAYDDSNNNGRYDLTPVPENFIDLPEPFVDSNDNGVWDDYNSDGLGNPAEKFIDANGDGKWNPANESGAKWDAQTLIWTSERILWTGVPAPEDGIDRLPQSPATVRSVSPNFINMICPGGGSTSYCAQAGQVTTRNVIRPDGTMGTEMIANPVSVTAYLADPWFNGIAANADSDGCAIPDDEMSPITTSPKRVNPGQKFLYPAGDFIRFAVRDKRDPQAKPEDQIPRRSPPIGFSAPVNCTFTSSEKNGHVFIVGIGNIYGLIE